MFFYYVRVAGEVVRLSGGPENAALAFGVQNKWVLRTELGRRGFVSTVFLPIDHGFMGGPPILWETMVFDGPRDGYMNRYASEAAAKRGHRAIVRGLRGMNLAAARRDARRIRYMPPVIHNGRKPRR